MLLDLYTEERQNEFGAVYIKYPRSACDSGPNIVQPKQAIARGANTFRSNPNLRLCIEPRVCFGVGIHPLHIPPAGQRHSGGDRKNSPLKVWVGRCISGGWAQRVFRESLLRRGAQGARVWYLLFLYKLALASKLTRIAHQTDIGSSSV